MSRNALLFAALTVFLAASSRSFADENVTDSDDTERMASLLAEAMKFAAPGAQHELLNPLVGTWNYTTQFRMGPNAPWATGHGQSVNRWILGGRFLLQDITSEPSEYLPMEFSGFGLLGFNNYHKHFTQVWMDTFSTGVTVLQGPTGTKGQFEVQGEVDKLSAGKSPTRWVYHIDDENEHRFEMWETDSQGQEYLHGKITYVRQEAE